MIEDVDGDDGRDNDDDEDDDDDHDDDGDANGDDVDNDVNKGDDAKPDQAALLGKSPLQAPVHHDHQRTF